jgi:TetR/AcrR family transcriptional regulator
VFANEVMSGGESLPENIALQLHKQSQMIIEKFQNWIDNELMDNVPPHHLMFMIWASTQTYADFGWQICGVLGKDSLSEEDFHLAAEFLTKLVIQGCGVKKA